MTQKQFLLDIDYHTNSENQSIIELLVQTDKGIQTIYDTNFKPYFYVILVDTNKETLDKLVKLKLGSEKIQAIKVEKVEKEKTKNVVKLYFNSVKDLVIARNHIKELEFVLEKREYDIPFTRRYLIDKQLSPLIPLEIETKKTNLGLELVKLKVLQEDEIKLKMAAFDIETFSPGRFSDPLRDPILTISYVDEKEKVVFTTKNCKTEHTLSIHENETEMLKAFIEKIKSKQLDILITYNGDSFDLPYMKDRCQTLGLKFDIGFGNTEPKTQRKGMDNAVKIKGTQHVDAYQLVRILTSFGTINLIKFDLETVYSVLFGVQKEKLKHTQINKIWETGKDMDKLINYNILDSLATYKIAKRYLPLFIELTKLIRMPLFDISRAAASTLVEALLYIKSFETNTLIPNKPKEALVKQRMMQTYVGGYVKSPVPGLHENLAVLDFRSLYPSIMISHNISADTLDCKHETCKIGQNLAPTKHWFCEKEKGFLSSILENILNSRMQAKKEMKITKNKGLKKTLDAKQHALKIILNSFYGTLGYPRFRWYNRDSANAIAAWSRHYIRETIHKAEKEFKVVYSDTDSLFLIISKNKTQDSVKKFVKKINDELPENMELQLEGFFKRGIFVTKKGDDSAAKKKYALIDYEDNLKIVGFEYVRRDWSPIARNTQRKVIELILKEGKPKKAVEFVKKTIKELKSGKVEKKDLVIFSQIKKNITSYDSIGPHIAAAKKAIKKGKELGIGSVIGYIVRKGSSKKISDKAELEEFVNPGDYDADYYIDNQVIPAIIKIMNELGYSKTDLIQGGKQSNLFGFQ